MFCLGGKIEISTPELIAGQHVTVVVMIEDTEPVKQRHVINILSALPGHQLFQSAEEVDAYALDSPTWAGMAHRIPSNKNATEGRKKMPTEEHH